MNPLKASLAPAQALARPRLIRRMRLALGNGHLLIVAPAGFGKSTLLRALLLQQQNAQLIQMTIADADVAQLQARVQPLLIEGVTVLLDDVHHLHEASEALAWLNEQIASPNSRFVLCGRMSPDASWLRRFAIFDADQLAFSSAEAAALLSGLGGLPRGAIEGWRARTRGWPLVLSLLGRQLRELGDASQVSLLRGAGQLNDDELLSYLAERMIRLLPRELFAFMQAIALPLRFNDALAATMLNVPISQASSWRAELQQRNLFIEPAEQTGWFKVHDFVHEFLLARAKRQLPAKFHHYFEQITHWFELQGDMPNAIEHALLAEAYERASVLLEKLEGRWLWDTGRYRTYKHWVLSLPREMLERQPRHLARLGRTLMDVDAYDEARVILQDALHLVQTHPDGDLRGWVKGTVAFGYGREGDVNAALAMAAEALAEPDLSLQTRQMLLNTIGSNLVQVHRLSEARAFYKQSLALAQQLDNPTNIFQVRHNLAVVIHQPLGQFDEARDLLHGNDAFCADKPGWRSLHLLGWAGLHEQLGEWPALKNAILQMQQADAELEQASPDRAWEWWYLALYATGTGDFASAQKYLDDMHPIAHKRIEVLACEAWARAWLFRQRGQYQDCIEYADELQPQMTDAPLYQAAIGIERARAAQQLGQDWLAVARASIRQHAQLRARPFLLRWRALLALACHEANDPCWRKHALATLRLCAKDSMQRISITREPELGAKFWALCLAEGFELDQAAAALTEIGQIDPVVALLRPTRFQKPGRSSDVPRRAAKTLAAIGNERAIPPLGEALAAAKDAASKRDLDSALNTLENTPPPLLNITLMGDFSVTRGANAIQPSDWERPIARTLFQYFVLQAGKKLTRDQIIEDLWPQADPEAARGTLKTTLSRMRKAIEPFLRPKTPARYFSVEGEVYRFGLEYVRIDTVEFEQTVRAALAEAERHDVLPVSADLVAQLLRYQPILPGLQYQAWTIAPRERLLDVYVKGCGYVAHARLDVGESAEAAQWAERAIAAAPWSEESYQSLMRAQSRQGDRALALRTYAACVAALQRELGVPPSQLTEWLGQRLRASEAI